MKRSILPLTLAFALTAFLTVARAADKSVTLKGDLVCAKCALSEADAKKCANVLVVKDDAGQETRYHLVANAESKKFDEKTCGGAKTPVTITGTVADQNGKKMLTATKIEG